MAVILKHAWNPPAEGSEERKKMPKDAFLSPSDRTFPYKYLRDGKWVASEEGLKSAIALANMHNHPTIAAKASKLLDELFGEKKLEHKSVDDVLAHYGVLGMKWGVRNDESKRRLKSKGSPEHQEARALAKKGRSNLSNAELKRFNERMNLEQQAKKLSKENISSGKNAVSKILKNSGSTAATTLTTAVLVYGGKQVIASRLGQDVADAMFRKKK